MKRKIFSKLLIGALLVASVSSFVSCKDYDDDIKDLQTQINSLSGAVDQKTATINQTITSMQQNLDQLNKLEATLTDKMNAGDAATLAAAKQAIADAKAALQASIDNNADAIAKNAEAIKKNAEAITANKADIAAIIKVNSDQDEAILKAQTAADQALAQIAELQASLADYAKKAELEAAKKDIEANAAEIAKIKQSIATINEKLAEIETIKANLNKVTTDLAETNKQLGTLSTTLEKAVKDLAELTTAVNGQQAALEALKARVDAVDLTQIDKDVKTLKEKIAPMEEQLAKLKGLEAKTVNEKFESIDATIAELKAAHETFASKTEVATLSSEISALKETTIPAVEAKIDAIDAKFNTLTAALSKALRGLVYQNTLLGNFSRLYVDGIEAIQYPYLVDTLITKSKTYTRDRKRTHVGYVDDTKKTIRNLDDYTRVTTVANYSEWFGPTWGVTYHMNPSKATPAYADVAGWARKDATIITRSTAGNNGAIQVSDKYADGSTVYSTENGILTIGLKVTDPKNLANHIYPTEWPGRPGTWTEEPADSKKNQFDDMIALQVNTKENDETKVITSDYAMIYPEPVWPEAIVWTKYDSKVDYKTVDFDEKCPYTAKNVHVWQTPEDALGVNDADVYPDIELYYDDADGVDLSKLLGIHYVWETKTALNAVPGTWEFGSENFKRFGLKYKFELLDYTIDGNVTKDSKYCDLTAEGVIKAKNVDAEGNTLPASSRTAVGREPLVRVIVSRGDRPILDGYILVHITETAPAEQSLLVDNYPVVDYTWNLCGDAKVIETNWSQFSNLVLHDKLNQMTKDNFDLQYGADYAGVPDLLGVTKDEHIDAGDGSTFIYKDVVLFNNKVVDGKDVPDAQAKTRDLPGQLWYYHNDNSTTNHRFVWYITGDELEEYTHENDGKYLNEAKKIVKWFRYTRATGQASDYQYIYVKLELNLKRGTIATKTIKTKNNNYWFKYDGNDTGWDAVVWNAPYPQDGGTTSGKTYNSTFTNALISTFVPNQVNFDNTAVPYKDDANTATRNANAKFYFTPYEFTIKAQDGTEYVITPRSGKNDQKWNAFVCKYLRWENDGTPSYNHIAHDGTYHNLHWYAANNDKTYTEHKWGTPEQNKAIHKNCAIYYGSNVDAKLAQLGINGGVYDNTTLYAVKKDNYTKDAEYTEIAKLNPNITSGQMTLLWRKADNDITKEVLNAIGYFEYDGQKESSEDFKVHWNITKELNCMVGVIAHNGCGVALDIPEYVKDADNTNAGTFYVTWQRPINVLSESKKVYDATNNGEKLYTVDFLQMFDWRGPTSGFMWGDNQWLWAYYDVHSITINTKPADVMTNMHQASVNDKVKLSSVTTMANLYTLLSDGSVQKGEITIPVDGTGTLSAYNKAAKNNDLLAEMGLKPENKAKKELFAGGIYYENNGDNVEDFDVWIPVTVNYEWGRFLTTVKVHIHRTLGN